MDESTFWQSLNSEMARAAPDEPHGLVFIHGYNTDFHDAVKGKRFAIVTLVFADEHGKKGVVPELLKPYVWKEPKSELGGLDEIIKAMPITLGRPNWRAGV